MMMMTISSLVKYSQWPDMISNRTERSQKSLDLKNDGFETTRPKRMRPRPRLHETEVETKTNYCET